MKKAYFVLLAVASFSTPATADVCDAVLTTRAFNITDSQTAASYKRAFLFELCKTQWNSEAEFDNRASQFNIGISYSDVFKGNENNSSSTTTNTVKSHYEDLCVKQDSNIVSKFLSTIHVQNTDAAVDAWKDCVTKRVGLWSALRTQPDTSRFVIEVFFRGATPTEKLTLTGYDKTQGFECKYNDHDIKDFTPRDHGGGDIFSLTCNKTAPGSIFVNINSNTGTDQIGTYQIPSDAVRDLIDRNASLEGRIRQLERASADQEENIESILPKVGERLPREENHPPNIKDWAYVQGDSLPLDDSRQYGFCALSSVTGGECTIQQSSSADWVITVRNGARCQVTCLKRDVMFGKK
ncbi:MAG: hypothetical protein WB611_30665 [Stellaceae bacterium]